MIKSATICNDDLIGTFVFFEVFTFASMAGFIHGMSPGKFALNYYICLGQSPELLKDEKTKVKHITKLELITLPCYLIVQNKVSSDCANCNSNLGDLLWYQCEIIPC